MEKINISFRPMSESDLDQLTAWMSNFQDLAAFDRSLPAPVSRESLEESWKPALKAGDPPSAFWFMVETDDNTPVGMCGLQAINYIHGDAVVPLFVAKGHRRNGLAKAMGLVLVDLAFKQLRLNRVSTVYRADNTATEQIVKCLGFTEEGRVRQGWFANGNYNDIVQVGLLRAEWEENRSSIVERLSDSPFHVVDNVIGDSQ